MLRILCILLLIVPYFSLAGCRNEGSEAPLLLLARQENFGLYTAEILKAEGFNEFAIDSLEGNRISRYALSKFDIVILSEPVTDRGDVEMIRNYVRGGGNLIVFQPGGEISGLCGVKQLPANIAAGSISIDTTCPEGRFLTGRRIRLHTIAGKYKAEGGKAIVCISDNPERVDNIPAVVINSYGKGHTYGFLYNLPENVVLTRQGNPLSAGIEKDGIPGLRAMDLFTDGWVNASNSTINQADEQMMLLSKCIELLEGYKKPLPRLWYFPDTLKCLVTLTNDGEFRGEDDFEKQLSDVDSAGARMSLYVMETDKVTKRWTDKWRARGFEISGHPDDTKEAAGPRWDTMQKVLDRKMGEMKDLFQIPVRSVVNHWFVWCGNDPEGKPEFSAQAEIEANRNLGMDINYAHYDNNSSQGHFLGPPGLSQGNFTGSGLPMKFAGSRGNIINIYQHLNNVYDQEYNEMHDPDNFFNCFRGLMDRSIDNEVYSYISIKSHNDEYYFSKAPLMKMLSYAGARGVPVRTAENLLDFLKMKEDAAFKKITWTGQKLSFVLSSSIFHESGLTFMVPFRFDGMEIKKITDDGSDVPVIIRKVRGSSYAFHSIKPGTDHSIIISYDK
jgi:hypothetical protein